MALTEEELSRFLAETSGKKVQLRLNSNRQTMLSVRPSPDGRSARVSIHRVFLSAGPEVLRAAAGYLAGPSASDRRAIKDFIEHKVPELQRQTVSTASLRQQRGTSRGKHHNLVPQAQRINEQFFGGSLTFHIVWGRRERTGKARRRHVTLGSALVLERLIRIHPVMDTPHVPQWFLDFVIFHEMLHLYIPPYRTAGGRNAIHSPEFERIERLHPHYHAVRAWEKKWVWKMMNAWEVGTELPRRALVDFQPPALAESYRAPWLPPPAPVPPPASVQPSREPEAIQQDLFGDLLS
ncbi:MAG: hypothetical protein JJU11_00300 [Candidatus Sumerlaeia bacterium]|nr:hypothetical protein [Candidatus Sumerlaeia bacterium]